MSILLQAHSIIHGDREKTHGDPGRNLRDIAAKWSVTLQTAVTPEQVALCMIDLKTVRAMHDPGHHDHWVDIAGYAGLVDRCGFLRAEAPTGGIAEKWSSAYADAYRLTDEEMVALTAMLKKKLGGE